MTLKNVTSKLIKEYQISLLEHHSPSTIKRKTTSLRRFFAWAKENAHTRENPFEIIPIEASHLPYNFPSDQILEPFSVSLPFPIPRDVDEVIKPKLNPKMRSAILPPRISTMAAIGFIFLSLPLFGKVISQNYKDTLGNYLKLKNENVQFLGDISSASTIYSRGTVLEGSSAIARSVGDTEVESSPLTLSTEKNLNSFKGSIKNLRSIQTISSENLDNKLNVVDQGVSKETLVGDSSNNNFESYYLLRLDDAKSPMFKEVSTNEGDVTYILGDAKILGNLEAGWEENGPTIYSIDLPASFKLDQVKDKSNLEVVREFGPTKKPIVGRETILSGRSEVTIRNSATTNESLIYLTPTSDTKDQVLYVKQKGEGFFRAGFTKSVDENVQFDWWVVDDTSNN